MKKAISDRLQFAKLLQSQGVSVDEILSDSVFADLNPNTRRTWRRRLIETAKPKIETQNETPALPVSKVETPETVNETLRNAPGKPAQRSAIAVFVCKTAKNFHPADLLFYAAVSVGCSGVSTALQSVGAVSMIVSCILFGVSFIALQGLKTAEGWIEKVFHGGFMLFVESVFFCSDLYWANKALWANVHNLPLDIWPNKYRDAAGDLVFLYGGSDIDKPFYIACGVAFVLFSAGAYACIIALQGRK